MCRGGGGACAHTYTLIFKNRNLHKKKIKGYRKGKMKTGLDKYRNHAAIVFRIRIFALTIS